MERLHGWMPLGVHAVTDSEGRVALVDRDRFILFGPVNMGDEAGVTLLCDWLRGYILDTN